MANKRFDVTMYHDGEPEGRIGFEKLRDGNVVVIVEEWVGNPDQPLDAEAAEVSILLSVDEFRDLLEWGRSVVG